MTVGKTFYVLGLSFFFCNMGYCPTLMVGWKVNSGLPRVVSTEESTEESSLAF